MNAPDVEAFAALVRDCAGLVLTVLTRTGCPDPEDLAQETFTRAYAALRRRPDTVPTRAWLVTIALNVRRNELRRLARRPTAPLDADPPTGDADRDLRLSLEAALARLPEAQRVPVVLRHVAGLPYDDVAVALGRPVGTVKSQVSRGLAALRVSLEGTPA
jgi:RNA polymerase sigma-70 factor (ECF subfamily)